MKSKGAATSKSNHQRLPGNSFRREVPGSPALRAGRIRLGQIGRLARDFRTWVFLAIMALGIFSRTWELGSLPPPMYPDEYIVSVDAYSLLHYGVDHNLVSYPVFLTSWGEGTSALYAYLVIPFFAVGGASPFTFRLPMLLAAILTLPLIYLIARQLGNARLGLISMFLLAISPWHIMLSRWALECNILPFVFSIGFLALLMALRDQRWFVPGMLFMGLCLYAYATALAAVPLFLIFAMGLMGLTRSISRQTLILGLVLFGILAGPMAGFVAVNTLHLESVHLGPITIPRLPATPRFQTVLSPLSADFLQGIWRNLGIMARLLVTEVDSHIFNTVTPYGYLYRYTFPLAVGGAALLVSLRKERIARIRALLLMSWLAASLSLGIFQDVNANRINLIFIPLILCVAVTLDWAAGYSWQVTYGALAALLIGFGFFTRDYHSAAYRSASAEEFWSGALPAIDLASSQAQGAICVTDEINYIVVLFHQAMNSQYYPQELRFDRPRADIRLVPHLYPYTFGLSKCLDEEGTVYVLSDEPRPQSAAGFSVTRFGLFSVYVPPAASPP